MPEVIHLADEDRFPVAVALCGDNDAPSRNITFMRDRVTCPKCKSKKRRKR